MKDLKEKIKKEISEKTESFLNKMAEKHSEIVNLQLEKMLNGQTHEPKVWFDQNASTIKNFLSPVFEKYRDNVEIILDEVDRLSLISHPKPDDFPNLLSFCRDGVNAFQKMWEFFYQKDELINLYKAYEYRVVEIGGYTSTLTYLSECVVIFPILKILFNTADGSPINFWMYETVITNKEWESFSSQLIEILYKPICNYDESKED